MSFLHYKMFFSLSWLCIQGGRHLRCCIIHESWWRPSNFSCLQHRQEIRTQGSVSWKGGLAITYVRDLVNYVLISSLRLASSIPFGSC